MTNGESRKDALALLRAAAADEHAAIEFFECRRWGNSPACPRCGDTDVKKIIRKDGQRERHYRWRCRGCKRQYSVRTGTVFEETRLPMRVWAHAFWRCAASKKGVSSLQISRECGIGYRAALFMMHRIRHGMAAVAPSRKLRGTVEADETFVGGKPRVRGKGIRPNWTDKTPVFAVVARGGQVRMRVMEKVTARNLDAALAETVDESARLITDESASYKTPGLRFVGGHETVHHKAGEYARGDVTTNTVEGVFSLLKRGMYGTFHSVTKQHLHRYLAEFEFRYNSRSMTDAERVHRAIKASEGKRLTYREPGSRASAA